MLDLKLKHSHSIWKLAGGLSLLLISLHMMPVWAAEKQVGHIKNWKSWTGSSPSDFEWKHGWKRKTVGLYEPLYNGDTITVGKKAEITLSLLNGDNVVLTYNNTKQRPYRVDVPIPKKWWRNVGSWFSGLLKDPPARRITAVSKGEKIEIALLNNSPQELGAGKDVVYIAWTGGTAPYTIDIARDGYPDEAKTWKCQDEKVCSSTMVEWKDGNKGKISRIAINKWDFAFKANASYFLEITDKKGNTSGEKKFVVVPKNKLSFLIPDDSSSGGMELIENLASQQAGKKWRFEAYQYLVKNDAYERFIWALVLGDNPSR